MDSLRLSSRDLRALVIGVGVISAVWVAARGLPMWSDWRHDAQLRASEAQQRYRAERAAVSDLPADLTLLEGRLSKLQEYRAMLLLGSDSAGAEQVLAGLVAEAARLGSVSLETLQVRTEISGPAPLRLVTVEARGAGDVTGLTMLLGYLEGGSRLLVVRRLSVQAGDPWSPESLPEFLTIDFTVEGLVLFDSSRRGAAQ